jgi:hypothetical protein
MGNCAIEKQPIERPVLDAKSRANGDRSGTKVKCACAFMKASPS